MFAVGVALGALSLTACSNSTVAPTAPATRGTGGATQATVTIQPPALLTADDGVNIAAPGVLRRRAADLTIQRTQLDGVAPEARLVVNLFADTAYVAVFDHLESTPAGKAWVGRLDGIEGGVVVLAVGNEGVLTGSVTSPGVMFSVTPADTGRYWVSQVNLAAIPRP